jgi:hypothetical protein
LTSADCAGTWELGRNLFRDVDREGLERFYLTNKYFEPSCVFTLKTADQGELLGVAVAIVNPKYADPMKIDAAMPCFRLGAIGTEVERHKRVNGMFSCVFSTSRHATPMQGNASSYKAGSYVLVNRAANEKLVTTVNELPGASLLAEAARRFDAAGLTHATAQVPSDQPDLLCFYDKYFTRQGAFPILTRKLSD